MVVRKIEIEGKPSFAKRLSVSENEADVAIRELK
jgi:hypothetical protein